MSAHHFTHWQVHDEIGRRKYLSEDESARFLQVADKLPGPSRALCHMLMATGCRISEALELRRHQLDTDQLTLTVRTLKRRRLVFRTIQISPALAKTLRALPVADDGRLWTMHRATAWRIVKRVMEGSSVSGPMACCKGLRHGFGIRAARRNVPPNLIQRWMGHSSSSTTAIYLDAVGCEERQFAMRMW